MRDEGRGRSAAALMTDDANVIYSYTDRQAVEDGVLVPVDGEGQVNRVTRAVFDHFTESMGSSSLTGPVINITPLTRVIRKVLREPPDEDGWRKLLGHRARILTGLRFKRHKSLPQGLGNQRAQETDGPYRDASPQGTSGRPPAC